MMMTVYYFLPTTSSLPNRWLVVVFDASLSLLFSSPTPLSPRLFYIYIIQLHKLCVSIPSILSPYLAVFCDIECFVCVRLTVWWWIVDFNNPYNNFSHIGMWIISSSATSSWMTTPNYRSSLPRRKYPIHSIMTLCWRCCASLLLWPGTDWYVERDNRLTAAPLPSDCWILSSRLVSSCLSSIGIIIIHSWSLWYVILLTLESK